jgi:hypothetical protein
MLNHFQSAQPSPSAATPDWVDEELAAVLDELEGKKNSAQVDMHGTISPI